jgi:Uma2 family endonuclease
VTAKAADIVMWSPDTFRQRMAGYSIEDVLHLPDDAPRAELHDGMLHLLPAPNAGHQKIAGLVWNWLRRNSSERLEPAVGLGVAIDLKNTFEPDVLLIERPVEDDNHFVTADQVVIAVEIVSRGTQTRDRLVRPAEFAAAGIRHYWRIEQNPVHVFAYDLVGRPHEPVADSTEELVLNAPFDIKIPIRDITP